MFSWCLTVSQTQVVKLNLLLLWVESREMRWNCLSSLRHFQGIIWVRVNYYHVLIQSLSVSVKVPQSGAELWASEWSSHVPKTVIGCRWPSRDHSILALCETEQTIPGDPELGYKNALDGWRLCNQIMKKETSDICKGNKTWYNQDWGLRAFVGFNNHTVLSSHVFFTLVFNQTELKILMNMALVLSMCRRLSCHHPLSQTAIHIDLSTITEADITCAQRRMWGGFKCHAVLYRHVSILELLVSVWGHGTNPPRELRHDCVV